MVSKPKEEVLFYMYNTELYNRFARWADEAGFATLYTPNAKSAWSIMNSPLPIAFLVVDKLAAPELKEEAQMHGELPCPVIIASARDEGQTPCIREFAKEHRGQVKIIPDDTSKDDFVEVVRHLTGS